MPSKTEGLDAERKRLTRDAEQREGKISRTADGVSNSAEHTAYLHALTENNPLGIVVLDLNRRILMCNPAFESLFGYQQSEILGAELDTLLSPGDSVKEAVELSRKASAGIVVRENGSFPVRHS